MGFVFQQMNVLANLNLLDNIMLKKRKKERHRQQALELMAEFHIMNLADRRVTEVLGGQLQRACICRSVMLEPEILFADEPTGALNQSAAQEVMQAFLKLNRAGTSILMVTHDSRVASCCERILYLLDGKIRGELSLGKESGHSESASLLPHERSQLGSSSAFKSEEDRVREQKVSDWLGNWGGRS